MTDEHHHHDLTDDRWRQFQPLLPPQRPRTGRPAKDHRTVLNGMLWLLRTGTPWRDLPSPYGKWQTACSGPDLLTIFHVAELTFRGDLNDTAIAEQLGINRRMLSRWRRFDEYRHFIRALSTYSHRGWSTGRYATTGADLDADWAQPYQLFAGMGVRV